MRILYVEDHPRFPGIVIPRFLSAHQVTVAGTLAEARILLARETFDAVLLDYDLPDGKGGELLEEIRRQQLAVQVIGVSSREDNNARLLELGADAVVSKLKFGDVVDALQQLDCLPRP
jgi:DNA-binding response OmpR family regulator